MAGMASITLFAPRGAVVSPSKLGGVSVDGDNGVGDWPSTLNLDSP